MMRWVALVAAVCLALAGCSGESHQDLRAWMADQGKGARGRVDPLPQIRPYEPFAYNAFDLPDPFKPRKIEPTKGGSKLAPDLSRRREPLESYPLESLTMVGTLAKGKTTYALVRTPDILATLGQARGGKAKPVLVGFAAESGNPVERGRQKLVRKGADLIVANDISQEGAGFDSELNSAAIISRDNVETFPLGPKSALAALILDRAETRLAPLTT